MKKVFALLFVGSMLTFAACQSKPKTEETTTAATDSMNTVMADSASAVADSAEATADSAEAVADSLK